MKVDETMRASAIRRLRSRRGGVSRFQRYVPPCCRGGILFLCRHAHTTRSLSPPWHPPRDHFKGAFPVVPGLFPGPLPAAIIVTLVVDCPSCQVYGPFPCTSKVATYFLLSSISVTSHLPAEIDAVRHRLLGIRRPVNTSRGVGGRPIVRCRDGEWTRARPPGSSDHLAAP